MKRTASAQWSGGLKDGHGSLTTASHTLAGTNYSFQSRFDDGKGTNPEELLAAAHAGCFSMALAFMLESAGMKPSTIQTEATVTMEAGATGFSITQIHLRTNVRVPGADAAKVRATADAAKAGCPVSRALASVPMTMEAFIEI
jgi:lipoyl-dependent peroxiredoxin